ncbi:MAG: glycoside hydrolase family 5 protein [Ruminococcus sp.]|jgi:endoglucanase|nr:glycoside hydrolase family 5 protein [Ruminococcus sp.]
MTEALWFTQNMWAGWNLGNVFDSYDNKPYDAEKELSYITSRNNPAASRELFQTVYDSGFRTLRLPVSWHNHVIDEDFTISKVWLESVKEAVDIALEIGFYVIINIHHDDDPAFYYPDKEHLESSWKFMKAIWSQLAETFADYDEFLLFEAVNEPRLKGTEYEWKPIDITNDIQRDALYTIMELNGRFVDLVRSKGGFNEERYLLVPSHAANYENTLNPAFDIPEDTADNKIIVSVHAYIPYPFALAPIGSEQAVDTFDPEDPDDTKYIDGMFEGLREKYTGKGIPVVIGEYGASNRNENTEARAAWTDYYVSKARSVDIPCVWWDNGSFDGDYENFAIIRRDNLECPYPEILRALVENKIPF